MNVDDLLKQILKDFKVLEGPYEYIRDEKAKIGDKGYPYSNEIKEFNLNFLQKPEEWTSEYYYVSSNYTIRYNGVKVLLSGQEVYMTTAYLKQKTGIDLQGRRW